MMTTNTSRRWKTRAIALAAAVLCVWFAQAGAAQNQERYKLRLATVPSDGGMRETVAGNGAGAAVLAGNKLTISGTFQGLRSPATVARLHNGLARGVRGPAVADITVAKATTGAI